MSTNIPILVVVLLTALYSNYTNIPPISAKNTYVITPTLSDQCMSNLQNPFPIPVLTLTSNSHREVSLSYLDPTLPISGVLSGRYYRLSTVGNPGPVTPSKHL